MKPFAVVAYNEHTIRDAWFRAQDAAGRRGRGAEIQILFNPQDDTDNAWRVQTTFFDNEVSADAYIIEALHQNPGNTYLKLKTIEVSKVTIGPVQKARVTDEGVLPF